MKCFFCEQDMLVLDEDKHFKCENCSPHVWLTAKQNNPHVVWSWVSINGKKYQTIWYVSGGLHMFRLYDEHREDPIVVIKEGCENIKLSNLESKVKTLLTYL